MEVPFDQHVCDRVEEKDGDGTGTNDESPSGGSVALVNGDGDALVANQGAGANSFCVQEPLEACDPADGVAKPLAKGTEVLRADAGGVNVLCTRINGAVDPTCIPPAPICKDAGQVTYSNGITWQWNGFSWDIVAFTPCNMFATTS